LPDAEGAWCGKMLDDFNFDFDLDTEALAELGTKLAELAPDALNLVGALVDAVNAGLVTADEIASLVASPTEAELDAKARALAKRALGAKPDGAAQAGDS
jgi:hypothetical protein